MDRAQRMSIGFAAVAFAVAGVFGLVTSVDDSWTQLSFRGAIILAAIWFGAPAISRLPRRVAWGAAAVGVVLIIRPRLILWGLVAAVVTMFAIGRSKQ